MFCKKFFNAVLESSELKHCGKLGAWKLRSKGLLEDMTAMKNICRNRKGINFLKREQLKNFILGKGNVGAINQRRQMAAERRQRRRKNRQS